MYRTKKGNSYVMPSNKSYLKLINML